MADDIQLQFVLPGRPTEVMELWRDEPPEALARFALADAADNALTFERKRRSIADSLCSLLTFGVLNAVSAKPLWRTTARFDGAERGNATRITIVGRADAKTRSALGALAGRLRPPCRHDLRSRAVTAGGAAVRPVSATPSSSA